MPLVIAALLGFFSVGFGAYAEHGLKASVNSEQFEWLMTALRYNQLYAVLIAILGLILLFVRASFGRRWLQLNVGLFIIGTVLFCFSIYGAVLFDQPSWVRITPLGGALLMIAWLSLGVMAVVVTIKKNKSNFSL